MRKYRAQRGPCAGCGYDLRAHPTDRPVRCPECGGTTGPAYEPPSKREKAIADRFYGEPSGIVAPIAGLVIVAGLAILIVAGVIAELVHMIRGWF